MARLSTCKQCGTELTPIEKKIFNGKSYCETCYSVLRRDADAYKALIDNICKIFTIEQPTGLMLKQLKEYKNNLKYTYAAMNYTLWYITNVLTLTLDLKYGVVLIKYNYDEARQYFEQQQRISDSISNVEVTTKIVKKGCYKSQNNFNSLIDISKIIEGGDKNKL